jgi:GTP-binding protein
MVEDPFAALLASPSAPLVMRFVSSASHVGQLPGADLPEVCLVGRSNVGKSSLLNFMAGQKGLARVSQTPGRTRLLNLFSVTDPVFQIVDLPGYGFARLPQKEQAGWQELMRCYFEERLSLRAFLFLQDVRRQPNDEDRRLFFWLRSMGHHPIIAVTKSEKIHKGKWIGVRKELAAAYQVSGSEICFTSAYDKVGLPEVRKALWGVLSREKNAEGEPVDEPASESQSIGAQTRGEDA